MAVLTNTATSIGVGTAGGIREDLEDVIWDLFADETYCLTNFSRGDATGTYHEWVKDELANAGANIAIEGDDFGAAAYTAPTRLGNYVQTARKDFLVSGILEEVKKAGRRAETARIAMKRMRELKNDIEYSLVRNAASSAGGASTGRASAGIESWLATNEILSTTTASATTVGFSGGVVAAPTDGTTTAAFTEGALKSALNAAWAQGGDARVILVNASQKAALSAFPGVATKFNEIKGSNQGTVIGAVDMYVSDVGNHAIFMHRHVRSSVALCIDPEYWSVAFLRKPRMENIAKSGDAEKRMILADFTLVSRNEKASAKVVALS
jgi:hypothetical protein